MNIIILLQILTYHCGNSSKTINRFSFVSVLFFENNFRYSFVVGPCLN